MITANGLKGLKPRCRRLRPKDLLLRFPNPVQRNEAGYCTAGPPPFVASGGLKTKEGITSTLQYSRSSSSLLWMNGLEEPFRGYFPPNSCFSRSRQNFAPDRSELQPEADVIAETTYGFALRPAGMLTVNELR
jgi:hypothetical protein